MAQVSDKIYAYSWYSAEENNETVIRVYGLNTNSETVCLRVINFTPYVYVELPTRHAPYTPEKVQAVRSKLNEFCADCKPLQYVLVYKYKLYGAYVDSNGEYRKFPYLMCSFKTRKSLRSFTYRIGKGVTIKGMRFDLKVHETEASDVLQLTCCKDLPTAGWIRYSGRRVAEENRETRCADECIARWSKVERDNEETLIPRPLIMSMDTEVYSSVPGSMPLATRPSDRIFQISCVFARYGDPPSHYRKFLLTLGSPDETVGEDVTVIECKSEAALLEGYADLVNKENPNVITGYNIMGFDFPYMIARARNPCFCIDAFQKHGFVIGAKAEEREIKWSSSAYRNQEFRFLDAEGRIMLDLLPLVKRDFKFENYKLKTVSEYFLGQTKDPLTPQGIFRCYQLGTQKQSDGSYSRKARRAIAVCGKYCVQDSALTLLLTEKLQTWIGLTEMAATCCVQIFTLYTKGQQIKVYSQFYKYCLMENIVVESNAYTVLDSERYVGAHVFDPIPGNYKNMVPFDFASLYPTTIIAQNIDYRTWVPDDVEVPDEKCNVMKWQDCVGCEHDPNTIRINELTERIEDVKCTLKKMREKRDKLKSRIEKQAMQTRINELNDSLKPYTDQRASLRTSKPKHVMCSARYYRFLKEPKGVLPTICESLLNARKHTRSVDMVRVKQKIRESEEKGEDPAIIEELKRQLTVLDKRQLAYKVSANSLYGAMGVRRGYLPFMPGAMCTTYIGRTYIDRVAKLLTQTYGGKLIYGDTDSNYVIFPEYENRSAVELWEYAEYVAEEVSKAFPRPMRLEFEEAIYPFFLILDKKKQYMYRAITRKGADPPRDIKKSGGVLVRRDNSKFVRDVYESVVTLIADNSDENSIRDRVVQEINTIFGRPLKDFTISKSVGSVNDFQVRAVKNEKGVDKVEIGDYKVNPLPADPKDRAKKLREKGARTELEYYERSLPAQVQLGERMKRRGQRVAPGSRILYVVLYPDRQSDNQSEKIEDFDYFRRHVGTLTIDYFYYVKALANPLNQLLSITNPGVVGIIEKQLAIHLQYFRVLQELVSLWNATIAFE